MQKYQGKLLGSEGIKLPVEPKFKSQPTGTAKASENGLLQKLP